jgi:hypothetical protein
MSTYHAIQLSSGHWVLEYWRHGVRQGLVGGWFDTETEALSTAFDLAEMEYRAKPACLPAAPGKSGPLRPGKIPPRPTLVH